MPAGYSPREVEHMQQLFHELREDHERLAAETTVLSSENKKLRENKKKNETRLTESQDVVKGLQAAINTMQSQMAVTSTCDLS